MRWWPALRSVLIGVVLTAQWIDALPLPALRKRDLEHPIAQDEIKRWSGVIQGLGIDVTEESLVAGALHVGSAAIAFRRLTMAPIRPLKRWTGTGQSWGLFAYPDPYAGRLVVSARTADEPWQGLFSAPGSAADREPRRTHIHHLGSAQSNGMANRVQLLDDL